MSHRLQPPQLTKSTGSDRTQPEIAIANCQRVGSQLGPGFSWIFNMIGLLVKIPGTGETLVKIRCLARNKHLYFILSRSSLPSFPIY
ncbi:hypothetical protein [Microseira sp. BLCC-F43]|uniref:hypothetical protein n=1 Tax=Microseira sp. BLCC-F43 TaxID=3153602 RepID=UPI0035B82678